MSGTYRNSESNGWDRRRQIGKKNDRRRARQAESRFRDFMESFNAANSNTPIDPVSQLDEDQIDYSGYTGAED